MICTNCGNKIAQDQLIGMVWIKSSSPPNNIWITVCEKCNIPEDFFEKYARDYVILKEVKDIATR